jgi:excisionase family DNA binding protein
VSPILDDDYVTVAEAARELKVSESTIWRWIDQGQLLAYRVGQRRVRLKSADVARLITPARQSEEKGGAREQSEHEWLARPLTKQEKQQALAALEAAEQLQQQILARHGLKQFTPSSHELLDEARDERTRQLA